MNAAEVESALKAAMRQSGGFYLQIRVREDRPYAHLNQLIDIARRLGVPNLGFSTAPGAGYSPLELLSESSE